MKERMKKTLTVGMMLSCTLLSASSFAQQYTASQYSMSASIPLPDNFPKKIDGISVSGNVSSGSTVNVYNPTNITSVTGTYIYTYPTNNTSKSTSSRDSAQYGTADDIDADSDSVSENLTLELRIPKVRDEGDCYMVSDFGVEYLESNPYCENQHNVYCGDSPGRSGTDMSCIEVPHTKAAQITLKPSLRTQCYLVEHAYGALYAITPIVVDSKGGPFPQYRADDLCSRQDVKEDFRTFDAYPDFASLKRALSK